MTRALYGLALLFVVTPLLHAQSDTRSRELQLATPAGPWITVQPMGSSLRTLSNDATIGTTQDGPGISGRLGWAGDSTIALFLGVDLSALSPHDAMLSGNYRAMDLMVGARVLGYREAPARLVPYADGAFVLRTISAPLSAAGASLYGVADGRLAVTGYGGLLGGGVLYTFRQGMALDVAANIVLARMTNATVAGAERTITPFTTATGTIRAGLTIWPTALRLAP